MPYPVAEALVIALGVYGAAGVVFAVPFAWRGAGAIDPAAKRGTWGFRLLALPGVVALWPLMLAKWRRAASSPRTESPRHSTGDASGLDASRHSSTT